MKTLFNKQSKESKIQMNAEIYRAVTFILGQSEIDERNIIT